MYETSDANDVTANHVPGLQAWEAVGDGAYVQYEHIAPIRTGPISISTVKGPWASFGIHVDWQRKYVDLHVWWWIITIGSDYRSK